MKEEGSRRMVNQETYFGTKSVSRSPVKKPKREPSTSKIEVEAPMIMCRPQQISEKTETSNIVTYYKKNKRHK